MAEEKKQTMLDNFIAPQAFTDIIQDKLNIAEIEYQSMVSWIENNIPNSRLRSIALTNLETSFLYIIQALLMEDRNANSSSNS
jgi:hypothetical protein